jgi:hypothetical protein
MLDCCKDLENTAVARRLARPVVTSFIRAGNDDGIIGRHREMTDTGLKNMLLVVVAFVGVKVEDKRSRGQRSRQ